LFFRRTHILYCQPAYSQNNVTNVCVSNTLLTLVCQWLAAGQWFSPGPPFSSTNKTDCHDITEILLKVALITMNLTLSKILTLYNLRKKIFLEFCQPMEPTLFLFQEYYRKHSHILFVLKGHYLPNRKFLLPVKTIRYDWCLNKTCFCNL
jgi:hypothetical protein